VVARTMCLEAMEGDPEHARVALVPAAQAAEMLMVREQFWLIEEKTRSVSLGRVVRFESWC